MAREYNTAEARFVEDKMYRPPIELMANVIKNVDNELEQKEAAIYSLADQLKAEALKVDEPRLREIISGYHNRIDDLSNQLQENPLEFRRKTSDIRNLGREIAKDWNQGGEVFAIQENKRMYDDYVKRHLERVKATKGYVTQDDVNYARQFFLDNFGKMGGTSYQQGAYNTIPLEDLNAFVNLEDLSEERGKGYLADAAELLNAYSDGRYMYTSVDKKEQVKFNDILQGVTSAMYNDKELMDYYNQQIRFGRLTPEEVQNKIGAAAARVATKYSYTKTEEGKKSITGDPFAEENLRHAHAMARQKQQQESEMTKAFIDEGIPQDVIDAINKDVYTFDKEKSDFAYLLGFYPNETPSFDEMKKRINVLSTLGTSPQTTKKYMDQLTALEKNYSSKSIAGFGNYAQYTSAKEASDAKKVVIEQLKNPTNLGGNMKIQIFTGNGKKSGTLNTLSQKDKKGNSIISLYDDEGIPNTNLFASDSWQPYIPDVNVKDKHGKPKVYWVGRVNTNEGNSVPAMITSDDFNVRTYK